ncbi:hypothetical protein PFMALIP_00492 [Plasmodium falciparum MaliPS096_E11]|uniref:Uncharacterized protein n=1 Tax=Plasmodium falciparum MaliPS096_E11 TaxID=1036727 RepID=A0A024WY32_PLAFA|nr:hypothetical protein PFMALIP_00492 [Plasmodium falciparum MaliPS096_E11]
MNGNNNINRNNIMNRNNITNNHIIHHISNKTSLIENNKKKEENIFPSANLYKKEMNVKGSSDTFDLLYKRKIDKDDNLSKKKKRPNYLFNKDGEHFVNKENVQNNIIDDDDDDDDNHHDNVVVVYDKVKENEMNENKNKKSVKEDGLHNVLVELRNKDNLVVNDNIINKSFEKNNILYIKTSDSLNENYNERKIYKEINKEEYSNKNEYVHFKNNDDMRNIRNMEVIIKWTRWKFIINIQMILI